MWMLGHTTDVKTAVEMVVMLVMLVPYSGNIYHGQHMWVVRLRESMTNFEQAQGS